MLIFHKPSVNWRGDRFGDKGVSRLGTLRKTSSQAVWLQGLSSSENTTEASRFRSFQLRLSQTINLYCLKLSSLSQFSLWLHRQKIAGFLPSRRLGLQLEQGCSHISIMQTQGQTRDPLWTTLNVSHCALTRQTIHLQRFQLLKVAVRFLMCGTLCKQPSFLGFYLLSYSCAPFTFLCLSSKFWAVKVCILLSYFKTFLK